MYIYPTPPHEQDATQGRFKADYPTPSNRLPYQGKRAQPGLLYTHS